MLYMTKSDYEKILAHCKEGLPNESCGLIGGVREGDKKYIRKVYLLTNIDASNEHFSMDPREQRQLRICVQMDTSFLATFIPIQSLHPDLRRRIRDLHMIPR